MAEEKTEINLEAFEILSKCPLEKVAISDNAAQVLEQYSDVAHERITIDRARRRADIIRDFAGHDVPEWILEVAALADLAERSADVDSVHRNSRRYMHRYMLSQDGDPGENEVIKALAGLSYIERELGSGSHSRRRLGEVGVVSPSTRVEKNSGRHNRAVRGVDNPWGEELNTIQLADPEKLFDLTDQNMFVPLLVKAAQTLDMLKNRREITKTETRRYARDALEVYIPFCKIIGYDGLALALNDAALNLKVEGQKNYDEQVSNAVSAQYEDLFEGNTHLPAIAKVFDRGSILFDATVGKLSSAHDVRLGTFIAQLDGMDVEGRYRVKGLYALLSKVFSKNYASHDDVLDKLPMDMLGLTLITTSHQESAAVVGKLLQRIELDDTFAPTPTAERREQRLEQGYIHIQGTDEFINAICQENGMDREKISCKVLLSPDDYEVAKVTFMTHSGGKAVPTEIQVVTRESRDNGRRGVVGHLLYKLFGPLTGAKGEREKREKVSAILRAIHAQKKNMKQPIPITSKTSLIFDSFISLCVRAGV